MMRIVRAAALAAVAVLSTGAGKPAENRPAGNWTATVTVAKNGAHVLGNPAAAIKVTEFVSYTCSHCADFHKQSDAPMKLAYVRPGKVSVQVQHLVRDPIDLTAAMLTNCGEPARFFTRHNAFMQAQAKWLATADSATAAQRQRWTSGPTKARMQAIASDFGFYRMVEAQGLTRAAADRCLADEAMMKTLMGQTEEAVALGVTGTPSFVLNGALLENTHDWPALDARIKSAL